MTERERKRMVQKKCVEKVVSSEMSMQGNKKDYQIIRGKRKEDERER